LGRGLELLVGNQEPPVHFKIGVVVLIEDVRRRRIEVVENRAVAVSRAPLGQKRSVS
jgi:hypothetical protein